MNNIKLKSRHNNINIFTNKNIRLKTNPKTCNLNNYINKSNSEKPFKNNNILASDYGFDSTHQKLNFNFNFNFPTDECQKFLNRKRQANNDKKNKNFNLNLNLNVNVNTSDNHELNNLNNKTFNTVPFNKHKYSNTLRSLKENKSLSNQTNNIKNNLMSIDNNINFPSIQTEINPLSKKLKFINLKTRSSSDLLNENFINKYLGDNTTQNDLLQKKASFDFEKYSYNFQKQHRQRLIESNPPIETRKNLTTIQSKNEFKFNFDLLNVNDKFLIYILFLDICIK